MGVNMKRKMRKIKREGQEGQGIVDNLGMLLSMHGFTVSFPHEIVPAVEQLLREAGYGPGGNRTQGPSPAASMNRLAQQIGAPKVQVQTTYTPQASYGSPELEDFEPTPAYDNPWEAAAAGALSTSHGDFNESPTPRPQGNTRTSSEPPPMDPDQMRAQFEAKQAKMMERVATQGVRYSHGAGPAQGQRMAPHPSIKTPKVPDQEFSGFGNEDIFSEEGDFSEGNDFNGFEQETGGDDDSPRMKGGMSRNQALDLIQRATGHRPSAPGANPVMKPPRF
jgi:hypothetical protein